MDDGYIKSATATVQNGVAKADGKFSVTTSSIHFEPYNKEFGLGPYKLDRNAVVEVKKCWGKGGGILPVTSDGIELTLEDGSAYQFIVANPDDWLALLGR
ncbi:hypothetical protein [Marinobacter xestospongiae]|uniref:hypothetical protein n=1 Tax=Marinobacter xestospongiae TaxID=994319 RepID=UPI0020066E4F|nr:hypothetical protein [Marinobacter xestospongiae]MCK7568587.1 hypothetical protein [Marinobacter xestospongiae]